MNSFFLTALTCSFLTAPGFGNRPAVENDELLGSDWAGVREAYKTGRHLVLEVEGGYQAYNPGQKWLVHFDGRGLHTEPDAGSWTWGLQLESWGFVGAARDVSQPMSVSAEGGRVAYRWDADLEEWFINDSRGLEHGYTVHACPSRGGAEGEGPLTFTLRIRGNLQPEIGWQGRGVRFLDDHGAIVLTYSGLTVFDASGRALPASFAQLGERLLLEVEEHDASYPLTIDPLAQQVYLKASNTDAMDQFGHSVSVCGDTIVVGARGESSMAAGVNGNQGDNSASGAGAAYVFVRDGTTWSQQAYLKASNPDGIDEFGSSVSISGDTVVIGACSEASTATGVDGDQSNNGAFRAGAAYVFVRTGTTWSQEAYLKASNTGAGDLFGWSVSASGDTVVVGAFEEGSNATGVNGNQNNDLALQSGAAYVFVRNGTTWSQEAYLKASNTEAGDNFGYSIAVSDDTMAVGTVFEDSAATGVNGNQGDNSANYAGAVYTFVRNGTSWSQQAYLKASNTDAEDLFGYTLSLSGETLVVGAGGEDSNATGVNGNQGDNSLIFAGAAYVFARNGTTWSQEAYLKASNTDERDHFGTSVAVWNDTVAVGSIWESSGATGVNGSQGNGVPYSGAAYVFRRVGPTWSQQAYLKASNTDAYDELGQSLSVSGDLVVVGARYEKSSATGVNGDQGDNGSTQAGAAYVFIVHPGAVFCPGDPGVGTPCPCVNDNGGSVPGSGCANGVFASGAQLTGSGVASVSSDTLVLRTTHLEPGNSGLYFQADNDLSPGIVWGNGLRCAGGNLRRLEVRFADANGTSSTAVNISTKAGNVTAGSTKYYQCFYRTTINPPCGLGVNDFNTSNGYAIQWRP